MNEIKQKNKKERRANFRFCSCASAAFVSHKIIGFSRSVACVSAVAAISMCQTLDMQRVKMSPPKRFTRYAHTRSSLYVYTLAYDYVTCVCV